MCCVVGQPCVQLERFYSKIKNWRINTEGQSVVSATFWAPVILEACVIRKSCILILKFLYCKNLLYLKYNLDYFSLNIFLLT